MINQEWWIYLTFIRILFVSTPMRWHWPSTQILLVTSTCQTIIDDDNQLPNILLNFERTVYFSNKIYHKAKKVDYYKVISTKVMAIWVAFFGHTLLKKFTVSIMTMMSNHLEPFLSAKYLLWWEFENTDVKMPRTKVRTW